LRLPAGVGQSCFPTAAASARALATAVAQRLAEGLEARGGASLVVSGGRSPAAFLDELALRPLAWSRVTVCLADERLVAPGHADRNEGLVRRHLLQGPAAGARLLPLAGEVIQPGMELAVAERTLAAIERPFDAVVLGMGEDGHTASLFPGAPGTAEALDAAGSAQVALVTPAAAPHPRITLTRRALLDSRAVMILIQGEGKRATIEQAAHSPPGRYPIAAILQQTAVPVHVYYSA
jgi:6-phosphogluconolactonase